MVTIFTMVRGNLKVDLICISLMVTEAEHFLMFIVHLTSAFEKCSSSC